MPSPDLLTILDRLALAYPEKSLSVDTLALYQQQLADIPLPLLDQAVSLHIRSSPWFPHISDLRQAAVRLGGQSDFSSHYPPGEDILAREAMLLEQAYFKNHVIDPPAWEKLARQLENVGRVCRAEELRNKLSHLQQLDSDWQRGES